MNEVNATFMIAKKGNEREATFMIAGHQT